MPITIACPECRNHVTFDDGLAGKLVRCPVCGWVGEARVQTSTEICTEVVELVAPPAAVPLAEIIVEQTPPQQLSVLGLIGGGLGAAIGIAVGRYAGLVLLIPAGLALLAGGVLSRTIPERNKPIVPASALQVGHGLWMLLGMVMLRQLDLNLIEVALLTVGAIWLAFWPSTVVLGILVSYQAVGLTVNGLAFAEATRNTEIHKALLVHLALRVGAVALMVYGLVEIGKRKALRADTASAGDDIPMAEPVGAVSPSWPRTLTASAIVDEEVLDSGHFRLVDRGLLVIEIGILIGLLGAIPMCFNSFGSHWLFQNSASLINLASGIAVTLGVCLCCGTPTARILAITGAGFQCTSTAANLLVAFFAWRTDNIQYYPPKPISTELIYSAVVYVVAGLASAVCFVSFLWWLARCRRDERLAGGILRYAEFCAVSVAVLAACGAITGMTTRHRPELWTKGMMIWNIVIVLTAACFLGWLFELVRSVRLVIDPAQATDAKH